MLVVSVARTQIKFNMCGQTIIVNTRTHNVPTAEPLEGGVSLSESPPANLPKQHNDNQTVIIQRAKLDHHGSNLRGNFVTHLLDLRLGLPVHVESPLMVCIVLTSILLRNVQRSVQICFAVVNTQRSLTTVHFIWRGQAILHLY